MEQEHKGLLVGVASKHGLQIDLHFGHADRFRIYRLGTDGPAFVEERDVEHYCQGGFGDMDKREVIVKVLADCAALFVAKIGDGPRQRLQAANIEAVDAHAYEGVDDALRSWFAARSAAV